VGYIAATNHPDTAAPRGSEAEREIAAVFGEPTGRDDAVNGDLLVERFYALDVETGDRYVADFLKGRVQDVLESQNDQGTVQYTLLLDVGSLQSDRELLVAYVMEVAHPADGDESLYLGLRMPTGLREAARLNFDGLLPAGRSEFRGPEEDDVWSFLLKQNYGEVTFAPRLIGVDGYNFLLSNTELFQFFRSEWRINRAVFVSELLLVDLTGDEQRAIYNRLLPRYPHR
jgi:hypothetical protein